MNFKLENMRVFLIVVVLVFAAVAAVPKNPQRIVGGSTVNIEDYPSMVALLYSRNGNTFFQACGGTIINSGHILTAAHCPHRDAVKKWRVRSGSTFANSGGTIHNTQLIIIHPGFSTRTLDNDIAIIRISKNITLGNSAQAAEIAGSNYNLGDEQVVWAVGWGTTKTGGTGSEQLRHVQIWTVNQDICIDRYASISRTITDNMLCSGWLDIGGRDQCQGDSGGPLYHNGVVVGVCSWGEGCALSYFPGVNTRVSRYASWVYLNS